MRSVMRYIAFCMVGIVLTTLLLSCASSKNLRGSEPQVVEPTITAVPSTRTPERLPIETPTSEMESAPLVEPSHTVTGMTIMDDAEVITQSTVGLEVMPTAALTDTQPFTYTLLISETSAVTDSLYSGIFGWRVNNCVGTEPIVHTPTQRQLSSFLNVPMLLVASGYTSEGHGIKDRPAGSVILDRIREYYGYEANDPSSINACSIREINVPAHTFWTYELQLEVVNREGTVIIPERHPAPYYIYRLSQVAQCTLEKVETPCSEVKGVSEPSIEVYNR